MCRPQSSRRGPRLGFYQSTTGTRFVIGLESKVDYQVFALANPNRVVVELPGVNVRLPTLKESSRMGLVKSFRAGLAARGKTRVVIDVTELLP